MGGIHGKIVSIDGNEVTLDVDRGTKIKFDKKKLKLINVGRYVDQKDQLTLLKAVNIIKNKIK